MKKTMTRRVLLVLAVAMLLTLVLALTPLPKTAGNPTSPPILQVLYRFRSLKDSSAFTKPLQNTQEELTTT